MRKALLGIMAAEDMAAAAAADRRQTKDVTILRKFMLFKSYGVLQDCFFSDNSCFGAEKMERRNDTYGACGNPERNQK